MSDKKLYSSFHSKVLPVVPFDIETEPGKIEQFKLVLDFNAIAKIEDELKRDLKTFRQWRIKSEAHPDGLTAKDITFICWACFDTFHPDVTLRQVRSWLGPQHIDVLWLVLVEMCFPGIIAATEAAQKLQENAGAPGESKPTPAA